MEMCLGIIIADMSMSHGHIRSHYNRDYLLIYLHNTVIMSHRSPFQVHNKDIFELSELPCVCRDRSRS